MRRATGEKKIDHVESEKDTGVRSSTRLQGESACEAGAS